MPKIINISGVIGWDSTPQMLREALAKAGGEPVEIHISSPGGFVDDGLEMFNLIRDYQGPVDAVLKGYSMSMASYIPLAAPLNRHAPGKIRAERNAVYMIHNALGGVYGNHHKVLNYGETLRGLSTMIAKEYARRTGKALSDVQDMMDKETYLFGDEIADHGFVDEMLDAVEDDDTDAETARASAQTMFSGMMAKMTADQTRMEASLQAAARMMACATDTTTPPPATAGNKQKEVQQMTLAELLAANPAAKTEYDAAMAAARTEGATAVENRVKAAAPFLNNAAYAGKKQVAEMAVAVVMGENTEANLKAVVAMADMLNEQTAEGAATGTEQPATPASQTTLAKDDGVISDAASLAARVAQMKGGA